MTRQRIRCAIYTRKSSDEGLDQAFNSLDAQHEACAAYIASQRHEGWVAAKVRYDDGGLSGGTLDRPGLQHLLDDIEAGLIQMVVVYKIDRLTRSLADFARLVERFDAAGCSFVSVTQAFNTASSMGRLTLNVLLSFAQFEREVTAERIRDKIAASKKKGLWMGGNVPLGYDAHPDPLRRELVVNPDEAETVRIFFRLYRDLGSLSAVELEAKALGLTSKARPGAAHGGKPLSRGQLHYLLSNPVYRGMIRHKSALYPGQHPAIVEEDLWHKVQEKLQLASTRSRGRSVPEGSSGSRPRAPLAGKLRDEAGDRLTPTHTRRHGRQIRYYVSNRLISGGPDPAGWRLPAPALEQAVAQAIAKHVGHLGRTHRLCQRADLPRDEAIQTKLRAFADQLTSGTPELLEQIVDHGRIEKTRIVLSLRATSLAESLALEPEDIDPQVLSIEAPFALRRRGVEGKVVVGEHEPLPDRTLIRALADAHAWTTDLRCGKPLGEIATATAHSESYIRTRAQLAFLSPAIQVAILEGRQPAGLTLEQIVRQPVPLDWDAQAGLYGFSGTSNPP